MAQEFKSVVVPEQIHEEGVNLASDWKAAGLGTLTHGDVYRAGILATKAKLANLNPVSKQRK